MTLMVRSMAAFVELEEWLRTYILIPKLEAGWEDSAWYMLLKRLVVNIIWVFLPHIALIFIINLKALKLGR